MAFTTSFTEQIMHVTYLHMHSPVAICLNFAGGYLGGQSETPFLNNRFTTIANKILGLSKYPPHGANLVQLHFDILNFHHQHIYQSFFILLDTL